MPLKLKNRIPKLEGTKDTRQQPEPQLNHGSRCMRGLFPSRVKAGSHHLHIHPPLALDTICYTSAISASIPEQVVAYMLLSLSE